MAKADQVGFFEKHAEKIAVAIAALVFLTIIIFKVASSPNATKQIGYGKELLSPTQMDDAMEEEANRVESAIRNKEPEQQKIDDPLSKLQTVMAEPLHISVGKIVTPIAPRASRKRVAGPAGGQTIPEVPTPPEPQVALAWAGRELVKTDTSVKSQNVAHVTSVLEYGQMLDSWKQAVKQSGSAMRILFLNVVAERQAMGPDGWGPIETLKGTTPLSDIPDFTSSNISDVNQLLNDLGQPQVQRSTLNPSYDPVYWPQAGAWGGWMHHLPRTEVSSLPSARIWDDWADQQQAEPIRLQMAADKLASQRESRASRTSPVTPKRSIQTTSPTMPGMPGGIPGSMPGSIPGSSGAPGGGTTRRRTTPSSAKSGDADALRDQAKAAQMVKRGNELLEEGREMLKRNELDEAASNFKKAENAFEQAITLDSSAAGASAGLDEAVKARFSAELPQPVPLPSLADMCRAGKVQFWYHDTTCDEGITYRYRLKLSVVNPVFDATMLSQSVSLSPVMEVTSPWSNEVIIPSATDFYITGADDRDGSAKISIYRMVKGLLMVQKATVDVGDVVGVSEPRSYVDPVSGTVPPEQLDVDFSTGYMVVDIDTDKSVFPTGASGVSGSEKRTGQVILLSPEGELVCRTVLDDKKDATYSEKNRLSKEDSDYLEDISGGDLR